MAKNRFLSVRSLTKKWQDSTGILISEATTYRRLRSLGFQSRIPSTKPLLNLKQKAKRLKWARRYSKWSVKDWQEVIFSDESKFVIGFGDQGPRVWRKKWERYRADCLKRSVKHPASLMVWGCVSARGAGNLCFLKPGKTVNTEAYINILEAHLLSSIDDLFSDEKVVFQQDLAPAHNSKKTKEFLHLHNIEVLEWPANSPDLNIIEFVWQLMKRCIQEAHPKTLDELKTVISAVWHSFTPEKLLSMVESMPRRIQAVINAKGDATHY